MKALELHRWDLTPAEAREAQSRLRARLDCTDNLPRINCVAGADVSLKISGPRSWDNGDGLAFAGVILYTFPKMEEIERVHAVRPLRFPYVPGLLSFREIPALLAAFKKVRNTPHLIFCDGQGYAHPRRMGLASHLGLLLDCPTIGVAKSVLIGKYREPARRAGSASPLLDPATGERLGTVLRTADGVKPVYISAGHRISLERAVELTRAVSDGYRIPRPTREADRFVGAIRRSYAPRAAKNTSS